MTENMVVAVVIEAVVCIAVGACMKWYGDQQQKR